MPTKYRDFIVDVAIVIVAVFIVLAYFNGWG
jgi:hypothetical protein